jgi:hypothetical protein
MKRCFTRSGKGQTTKRDSSKLVSDIPGGVQVEVNLACKILNTMSSLGMPESVKVE